MRILITGAGGFIGRHLLRSPYGSGFTIIPATRYAVGGLSESFAVGSEPWDQKVFHRVLAVSRPNLVVHCIGATHASSPSAYFESNACLTSGLLSAMEEAATSPRLILIGSAAEYGNVPADAMPVSEEQIPKPESLYAISKYAQTLLGAAAFDRGLEVLTLRVFNAVGIGMPENLAIPSFARRMIASADEGTPLRVGNLDVARDFIDVEEICRAIFMLALIPRWQWPLANLCSGTAVSLRYVFECLLAASGVNRPIIFDRALERRGEMLSIYGSPSLLKSVGVDISVPDFVDLAPKIVQWCRKTAGVIPQATS